MWEHLLSIWGIVPEDMDRAAINKIPSQDMVDMKGLVWNYILVLDWEFELVWLYCLWTFDFYLANFNNLSPVELRILP